MNILSIQSHVAYGHVGNSAAVFPMQRLGHEVWPIHTVQFSNHPGYGAFRGDVFPPALIDACIDGLGDRSALVRCDAVLSGYVGAVETGGAVLRAVARVKAHNPAALYCCDPVLGDVGRGVFVERGLVGFFMRDALPAADILTPNHFELEMLTEHRIVTLATLRTALAALHARGPRVVLVTSLTLDDTPEDAIDLAVSDGTGLWRLRTPKLGIAANGAGDAIAAMFLVHYLPSRAADEAMSSAASSIFGVLRRTVEAGARELLLVDAQAEIVAPTHRFAADRIA